MPCSEWSCVSGSSHLLLPDLESFKFLVMDHDDNMPLYQAVVWFVAQRKRSRRASPLRARINDTRIGRGVGTIVSEAVLALHLHVVFAGKSTVSSPTSPRCKLLINITPVGIVRKLPQEVPPTPDSPPEHDDESRLGDIDVLIKHHGVRPH